MDVRSVQPNFHREHSGGSPIAAVASSRISNLLLRTTARAKAIICRWPREKLVPPLSTIVSNPIFDCAWLSPWFSVASAPFCSAVSFELALLSRMSKRPATRKASLSSASSCCSNGSRLVRSVPWMSSGCCGMSAMFERNASRLILSVAWLS